MPKLILASNSPRRRELLKEITEDFTVEPSLYEERAGGLSAYETAQAFAKGKAEEVYSRRPGCLVLGADTVVALGDTILGKPKDKEDAARMLRLLSGRTHEVYTGIYLVGDGVEAHHVAKTRVTFHVLSEELIQDYVESGLPLDKAGAYGIQDGYPLVMRCEGSYTNVVGLPIEEVRAMLEARGGNKC